MRFTKMHGIGNDYVYASTFDQPGPADPAATARAISDRHFGVGADGLILIGPSGVADARMRMFNADGSEGEMCGNGIRCVAKFLVDRGIAPGPRVSVESRRGVLSLEVEADPATGLARSVRVDMGPPILDPASIPTTLEGHPPLEVPMSVGDYDLTLSAASMGNPHAVIYVEDVDAVPVEVIGPDVESHPAFPNRVNVHFVQVIGPGEVRMRTWERGSGVTLACGTGACAVCVVGVLAGRTGRRLLAHLPGGDLELEWAGPDAPVFMTGPAAEVFSGDWPGL